MKILTLSPHELQTQTLSDDHLQDAVAAIRTDGFVAIENAVALEHLDVLHAKMVEDAHYIANRPDAPFNWNIGNIQQEPPPFAPYLFEDVLMNPIAIAIAKSVFGTRIKNTAYTGNTALKSDARQPVHGDCGHLWDDLEVAHPAHMLVVNVPTVAVSPENGATELWLGTHLDTSIGNVGAAEVSEKALEARRAVVPPLQPTLPRGAMILRDMRMWHAGMPNTTDEPRPMIALIWSAAWLEVGTPLRFPLGEREFLSHPDLEQCAQYVEGDINYLHVSQGHKAPTANHEDASMKTHITKA